MLGHTLGMTPPFGQHPPLFDFVPARVAPTIFSPLNPYRKCSSSDLDASENRADSLMEPTSVLDIRSPSPTMSTPSPGFQSTEGGSSLHFAGTSHEWDYSHKRSNLSPIRLEPPENLRSDPNYLGDISSDGPTPQFGEKLWGSGPAAVGKRALLDLHLHRNMDGSEGSSSMSGGESSESFRNYGQGDKRSRVYTGELQKLMEERRMINSAATPSSLSHLGKQGGVDSMISFGGEDSRVIFRSRGDHSASSEKAAAQGNPLCLPDSWSISHESMELDSSASTSGLEDLESMLLLSPPPAPDSTYMKWILGESRKAPQTNLKIERGELMDQAQNSEYNSQPLWQSSGQHSSTVQSSRQPVTQSLLNNYRLDPKQNGAMTASGPFEIKYGSSAPFQEQPQYSSAFLASHAPLSRMSPSRSSSHFNFSSFPALSRAPSLPRLPSEANIASLETDVSYPNNSFSPVLSSDSVPLSSSHGQITSGPFAPASSFLSRTMSMPFSVHKPVHPNGSFSNPPSLFQSSVSNFSNAYNPSPPPPPPSHHHHHHPPPVSPSASSMQAPAVYGRLSSSLSHDPGLFGHQSSSLPEDSFRFRGRQVNLSGSSFPIEGEHRDDLQVVNRMGSFSSPFQDPFPNSQLRLGGPDSHATSSRKHNEYVSPAVQDKGDFDSGVMAIELLLEAAAGVDGTNLETAKGILVRLNRLVSPKGENSLHRVSFYFTKALAAKLSCQASPFDMRVPDTALDAYRKIKAHKLFCEISPLPRFAYFTSNQSILEALKGEELIHVIDFEVGQGIQWASFLQEIATRAGGDKPPRIRLTAVGSASPEDELLSTGESLRQFAETLDLFLEFQVVTASPECLDLSMLKLRKGEAVAVNFVLSLHTLLHENSSESFISVLNLVRETRPKIVTVVELEANHNLSLFHQRFLEALQYYTYLFDSLNGGVQRDHHSGLDDILTIEKYLLAPQIFNIVSCEGSDRTRRHEKLRLWRTRLRAAGLHVLPLSEQTTLQAECLLSSNKAWSQGYEIVKDEGSLFLSWQTRPLISASAWGC